MSKKKGINDKTCGLGIGRYEIQLTGNISIKPTNRFIAVQKYNHDGRDESKYIQMLKIDPACLFIHLC